MRRKVHNNNKRNKSTIKRYTAFVPKTIKASKAATNLVLKKLNYFLNNTAKTIKKSTKNIDKVASKSIHSLTKKHSRK